MKNKTPAEQAQGLVDKMADLYKKGAKDMLPHTLGNAVVELLQDGNPVTNQSLMNYLVAKLASAPGSPIEEYCQEAVNLLDHHTR